ncbi:MAG TPA: potassium channel protein [Dehalococcoidales bacterium]
MKYTARFIRIAIAFVLVVSIGTIGYMAIEKWSLSDAIYMTFITISTVGFKEVHELSEAGRIFTYFVMFGGIGTMTYTLISIVQYFVEGQLGGIFGRRHMKDEITKLSGHVILCGYGKVGQEVARVFENEGTKFVVIESNEGIAQKATRDGHLCIQGDATRDEVLKEAGIVRARALVAALSSDADNLYVTLSAKELQPDIFVVARMDNEASESKFKHAGANRTMSPYGIGGRRLAMLTLRPLVVDFVDTTMTNRGRELTLEDIELRQGSIIEGMTIKDGIQKSGGAQILAVRKKNDHLVTNPPSDMKLEIGDELVVIGTREQLRVIEGEVK